MRFTEIDLFGLYVAPIAGFLVVGWIAFVLLRRAADGVGLLEHVWHPALFELAVYVILVSSAIVAVARWGL